MYQCENCKFNNHGWCTVNKMNELKKLNIQNCYDFEKKENTPTTQVLTGISYVCKNCKYNNNGWCVIRGIQGLKKSNIQKCEHFDDSGEKSTYYERQVDEESYHNKYKDEIDDWEDWN